MFMQLNWIVSGIECGNDMVRKALLGQLGDTDVRLLRVFRAVVECGGFSAAELELNIGRSTISRHIKDLELRLGITLCRRGRSGFALTGEGKQIYDATLRLLASMDDFRSEVNDLNASLTGNLSIALFDKTVTNPQSAISSSIQFFDEIAPDVRLDIYVEPINEIESGIMEGRYQIGVIPAHRPSTSLRYFHLFDEQMYMYCGRDHRLFNRQENDITKADVLDCKYTGMGYHSPNMEVGRQLGLKRHTTAYDQEAVAHLVMSGRYIGYLPDHYARSFVEAGLIKPVCSDIFQYQCQFSGIIRRSPAPSRLVNTFVDCIVHAHAG